MLTKTEIKLFRNLEIYSGYFHKDPASEVIYGPGVSELTDTRISSLEKRGYIVTEEDYFLHCEWCNKLIDQHDSSLIYRSDGSKDWIEIEGGHYCETCCSNGPEEYINLLRSHKGFNRPIDSWGICNAKTMNYYGFDMIESKEFLSYGPGAIDYFDRLINDDIRRDETVEGRSSWYVLGVKRIPVRGWSHNYVIQAFKEAE